MQSNKLIHLYIQIVSSLKRFRLLSAIPEFWAAMEPCTVSVTNTDSAVGIDVDSMGVTLTANSEIQPATNADLEELQNPVNAQTEK